jgi:hypothetical protein
VSESESVSESVSGPASDSSLSSPQAGVSAAAATAANKIQHIPRIVFFMATLSPFGCNGQMVDDSSLLYPDGSEAQTPGRPSGLAAPPEFLATPEPDRK